MGTDPETLAVYAAQAARYDAMVAKPGIDPDLAAFLALLPAGGQVLDLGCGPGRAAGAMAAEGFAVEAWDPVPEMLALAANHPGVATRQAGFDDLDGAEAWDGIWANFSLLHAAPDDLPRHLSAMARALRPGGWLHLGMKTGSGQARDRLGRLYTYVTLEGLTGLLADAGLRVAASRAGEEAGLEGSIAPYIIVRAVKPGPGPEAK